MIDLEVPKKFEPLVQQAHTVALEVLRPISRKYDLAEHEYPKELDMLAALIDGLDEGGASSGAGATGASQAERQRRRREPQRLEPGFGAFDHGDVLGGCRPVADDAQAGTRQLRHCGGCR